VPFPTRPRGPYLDSRRSSGRQQDEGVVVVVVSSSAVSSCLAVDERQSALAASLLRAPCSLGYCVVCASTAGR